MIGMVAGFVAAFSITWIVVIIAPQFGRLIFDHDLDGVQKMHVAPVPRVGGLAIFAAFGVCIAIGDLAGTGSDGKLFLLWCCALPAFGSGLVEDLTKKVSPRVRLLCTATATLITCFVFHAVVRRVDLHGVDLVLGIAPVAFAFTVLAVSGMANSVNIIDGFNGLASVVSVVIFASIALVSHELGDVLIQTIALTMIGAILGFVIWNFPGGAIFLGDGGAYFIGFVLGESLVLLITRHPNVSASYVMVALYPLFETVFSIYRRVIVRGRAAGAPDAVHLHTLIYRRVMLLGAGSAKEADGRRRNSMTSPYLWLLNLLAVVPATLFWGNGPVLLCFTLFFAFVYVALYRSIVKFRAPRWLIVGRRRPSVVVVRPAFSCLPEAAAIRRQEQVPEDVVQ